MNLSEIQLDQKSVIVKCDFNVPIDNGAVADEARIEAALPTIRRLIEHNCKIVLVSHLGRPAGERSREMSLRPVAETLQKHLNQPVTLVDDFQKHQQAEQILAATPGSIFLLENIRFYPDEQADDKQTRTEFAKQLAEFGEVFVHEGFGDYRLHASSVELAEMMPTVALGLNYAQEVAELDRILNQPDRPLMAVIGGAKLSTKLPVLHKLLNLADQVVVGGAMSYTLLKAMGHEIGNSLHEEDYLTQAKQLVSNHSDKLHLPIDHIAGKNFRSDTTPLHITGPDLEADMWGLDIGPETVAKYGELLKDSKTILWNGPMGVFEWSEFDDGTRQLGSMIADNPAHTIAGGGDTLDAIRTFDLQHGIDHLSMGGGAMLHYLVEGELPSLTIIQDK